MFNLIGKKIVAVKGFSIRKRTTNIEPVFILFDDKKTFIHLEEQDYIAYHDCSCSARLLEISENETRWAQIFDNVDGTYPKANRNI